MSTRVCVTQFVSHPDLNALAINEVETFLSTSELSEQQRKQVTSAPDRNRTFANIVVYRSINVAGADLYDLRLMLRKLGIFVPIELQGAVADAIKTD
jgi:hypothetical protein